MKRSPPSALVIEDDQDILDLLKLHLTTLGFSVLGAETGERGLMLATANPPDLVMVDIRLPGIDGREVIHELRTDQRTHRCRIVICSVLDPVELTDIEEEADAMLAKPFKKAALGQVVRRVTMRGES